MSLYTISIVLTCCSCSFCLSTLSPWISPMRCSFLIADAHVVNILGRNQIIKMFF